MLHSRYTCNILQDRMSQMALKPKTDIACKIPVLKIFLALSTVFKEWV